MEDKRTPHQVQVDQQLVLARWPILAQQYFKACSLVAAEGWPALVEELAQQRQIRLQILSETRPPVSERESDVHRGAIEVLNWLLHLAEDLKDFPR